MMIEWCFPQIRLHKSPKSFCKQAGGIFNFYATQRQCCRQSETFFLPSVPSISVSAFWRPDLIRIGCYAHFHETLDSFDDWWQLQEYVLVCSLRIRLKAIVRGVMISVLIQPLFDSRYLFVLIKSRFQSDRRNEVFYLIIM